MAKRVDEIHRAGKRRSCTFGLAVALLLTLIGCTESPTPSPSTSASADRVDGRQTPRSEEVVFYSHDTKLVGTLVRPSEGELVAAAVFVHGSGKQQRNLQVAEAFAAKGIAALVYDKRGAGASEGAYESEQSVSGHNISLLADDAVAALQALRHRVADDDVPVGLTGISQAGWIVPLAAERTKHAQFIVLWSGPVCKVSEEDIFSKYTSDRDANEVPDYETALRSRKEPYVWPDFLGTDTDPVRSLEKLSIPGIWIFGANDGSVPVDLSIHRLEGVQAQDSRYEYVLFSGLGHNTVSGSFSTATDWIRRQSPRRSDHE